LQKNFNSIRSVLNNIDIGDSMPIRATTSLAPARPVHRQLCLALAAALSTLVSLNAAAQTAPAPAPAPAEPATPAADKTDGLQLDRIVVTGTAVVRTKMRQSVSVSDIDSDALANLVVTSAADALRSIPGLRSEASSGESNANVGVRGIPISAGGARYLQFQEDGLPVLMFGDIAFATPDTFLRADGGVDTLQVVRGGSASTLTTGSPGGIINFISKTGREEGGFLSLSKGLDFSHTRQEFGYGGKLAERTRFYIGGYYRVGDGGREGASGTEKGGQVRMNLTREFNGGYVRFSFKHLDDQTPTFLPTPVRFVNGKIEEIPGLDPRTTAFYNAAWPSDNTLTPTNGRTNTNVRDGLKAKSDVFGAEVDLDAGGGVKLNNKFRWSKNSGRFIGIFPGSNVEPAPAGTTLATDAGQAYSGNQFTAVIFNTNINDVGLMANDLKLSKQWDLGAGGRITGTAGLFNSAQDLEITWNFNQYSLTAEAQGARLLNVPGVVNGSAAFGGCCMNYQDSKYSTTAPYASIEYEAGNLNLDVSVRQDRNVATGARYQTIGPGGTGGIAYDLSQPQTINYAFENESFSIGANYGVTRDLAVFARYSDGASYLADRITFFNPPQLTNGASSVIPTNEVKQFEGGVKWRSQGLSLFATLFAAQTDEINVDPTRTPIRVTRTKYESQGLELEGAYRIGGFAINGGVTFTDAKVKSSSDAAIVGKTPKRQAKFVYQFSPSYTTGDLVFGASIVGTTDSKDDSPAGPVTVTLPGYTSVNLFANYQLTPTVLLTLGVNNATNTIGYTETNDGRGAARSINGRTSRATVKVTF
jgi:outer membrane receptor protein involved in Fe transport